MVLFETIQIIPFLYMCKQLHDIIKLFRLTLHVVNGKKKIRLPTDLSVTFDA